MAVKNIVTGATGFLGGELARALKKRGEHVVGIGRNIQKGSELEKDGIRFLCLDLADEDRVARLLREADYMFHCSALSADWGRYKDFYNANVLATRNVVKSCLRNGIDRLIHISTPSMYLDTTHRLNITEGSPFASKPLNDYTRTKHMAEVEVDRAHEEGLDVVTIRPRAIIGKRDDKIIPRILAVNHSGVPFIDGGAALMDLTCVENVVSALLAVRRRGVSGHHYNITNGEPKRFSEIVSTLFSMMSVSLQKRHVTFKRAYRFAAALELWARCSGLKNLSLTRYFVCAVGRCQTFDLTKARRELGYTPQKSIDECLEEMARVRRRIYHST